MGLDSTDIPPGRLSSAGQSLDRRITPLAIMWGVSTLAYSIVYPFLPLYFNKQRGVPMASVGIIMLLMGVARMTGPIVGGALVDALGRRTLLVAGPVVRGMVFVVLAALAAIDASVPILTATLMLGMFVGAFFENASFAYITDITSPERRPDAFGRIRVGLNVGWTAGPLLGGWAASSAIAPHLWNKPFAVLFALTAGLSLVTALIAYKRCPETKGRSAKGEGSAQYGLGVLRIFRLDPAFALFMAFSFLLFLASSQLSSTLSVYSVKIVGIAEQQLGMLYAINGLMIIFFQIPITRMVSRLSQGARASIGAGLYTLGYLSMALAGSWWHLAASVVVVSTGELLTEPAIMTSVSRMSGRESVGRYMGLYGLVRGLGYSVGPWLGATLYSQFAHQPLCLWSPLAIGALAAAVGFALMKKAPGGRVHELHE